MGISKILLAKTSSELSSTKPFIGELRPVVDATSATGYSIKYEITTTGRLSYQIRAKNTTVSNAKWINLGTHFRNTSVGRITQIPNVSVTDRYIIEVLPLEGAYKYSTDGATQFGFSSLALTSILQFPEHPYINGFISGDATALQKNINLTNVAVPFPKSYTNFSRSFQNCTKLVSIPSMSTMTEERLESVTDFSFMFYLCSSLSMDFNWNFQRANRNASLRSFFEGCYSLTTANVADFRNTQALNLGYLFYGCNKITEVSSNLQAYESNPNYLSCMFHSCTNYIGKAYRPSTTADVVDISYMFYNCAAFDGVCTNIRPTVSSNASYMFLGCSKMTGVDSITGIRAKYAFNADTNMSGIFNGCRLFDGDLLGLFRDGGTCTSSGSTFRDCNNMTGVGLSGTRFTISGPNIAYTFSGCNKLAADTDLSNITMASTINNATGAFTECNLWKGVGIGVWDFPNVENTYAMFQSCGALIADPIPTFFKNVPAGRKIDTSYMFQGCYALNPVLGDTTRGYGIARITATYITQAACMFNECTSLTTSTLYGFNPIALETARALFRGCSKLTGTSFNDVTLKFVASAANKVGANDMFLECPLLTIHPRLDFTGVVAGARIDLSNTFRGCALLTGESFSDPTRITFSDGVLLDIANTYMDCTKFNPSIFSPSWSKATIINASQSFSNAYVFDADMRFLRFGNTASMAFLSLYFTFSGCSKFTGKGLGAALRASSVANGQALKVDMNSTFLNCRVFNTDFTGVLLKPLQATNTFNNTNAFTGVGLDGFDMSETLAVRGMFNKCTVFEGPLYKSWKAPKATDVSYMFSECPEYNGHGAEYILQGANVATNLDNFANGTTAWNQSLTTWCMTRINTKPLGFDANSGMTAAQLPVWGTCPVV